ncbi:MAG TPA: translation elongation factor Ts [Armatimonadetes bacterium]|nr:translation elongation factor Ts [Armatimonadota bacterium]
MAVTAECVKELRDKTGAGMMDCKKALQASGGDMEKAITILREKGAAVLEKREGKSASEGTVACYIHGGGKIGVLVELNCETDFVAKTDDFKDLARDIAMHVAWSRPEYVTREDIPEDRLEKEQEINRQWALNQGKPEAALPKIVEGRIEKFFSTVVLMDQPFIKNEDVTIGELIREKAGKLGEKILLRRFVRFSVGEEA